MKSFTSGRMILVLAAAALLGMGTYASAQGGYGQHRGWGRGGGMMGYGDNDNCPGYGRGYERGPRGYGYQNEMSEEQIKQLDEERDNFLKETDKVRRSIYQKQLALRSELAKEKPDTAVAKKLQKEISELRSEFDQKRLDHQMKMNEIAPESGWGRGRGGRMGMGYGPGQGRGMTGYGPGQGRGMMGYGPGQGGTYGPSSE